MQSQQYLLLIHRNLKGMLGILAFSIVTYLAVYYTQLLLYKSETVFIINEDVMNTGSANYNLLQGDKLPVSTAENRLFAILNSNSLRDSLIYKLDLYDHYNLRAKKEFRYELALRKLSKYLKVNRIDNSIYKITVLDEDPYMAPRIANETTRLVNVISKEFMIKNIQIKLLQYRTIIDSLNRNHAKDKLAYENLLTRLQLANDHSLKMEHLIDNVIESGKANSESYYTTLSSFAFLLNNAKNIDLQAITVLTKAIPETKEIYLPIIAGCCYLIVIELLVMLLLIWFYQENKDDIMLIIRGK